jgi:hypothetical protein
VQRIESSQHAGIADLLIYFRHEQSRVRPYLSGGTGVVHFRSTPSGLDTVRGNPQPLPEGFSSTRAAGRCGNGCGNRSGWTFRYSFSETLIKNPISGRLQPFWPA